jgi:hypothetical protein
MKKWTEVPSLSFPIAYVPPMKKMKTEGAKNKVFKPQGVKMYLALFKITNIESKSNCD